VPTMNTKGLQRLKAVNPFLIVFSSLIAIS